MKFDMSAAWRDAMVMVSNNREVLLIVAGIFFFLPSAAFGFAVGDLQEAMLADPENAQQVMLSIYADWWWLILIVSVATIVGYMALLALLRDTRRPTVGEAIKTGFVGVLPALGVSILTGLALVACLVVIVGIAGATGSPAPGFVLGAAAVVLLIYVAVKLSLVYPVIAIDKLMNPLRVIGRSWQLTKGNSLRLFVFYLLLGVVYLVVATVISAVVGLLTVVLGPSVSLGANAIIAGIVSAVATVIFVAVLAATHRQLSGPSAASVNEVFE